MLAKSAMAFMGMNRGKMNPEELIPRLEAEFGYPSQGAQSIANKLVQCTPIIQQVFLEYWGSGEIPGLIVEEFTAERLMKEHGMNLIAAMLTLDWLVREPEKAKVSLKKGHDRIKPPAG